MANSRIFHSFLNGFPAGWRDFIAANASTFDQTVPWLEAFERYLLEPDEELRIQALDNDDGAPVGLLPLRCGRVALLRSLHSRGVTALSNYYTALFGPVLAAGCERELAPALARAVLDAHPGAAVFDLNPVADDAPFTAEMASEWQRRGYLLERYFRFGNWYLEIAGRSSKDYLGGLPGQLRSTIQRKGKKLRADSSVRIRIITEPADVPAAMSAYESVYRRSWKTDEPHKEFIRAIALAFAQHGWLRLGLVEVQDRPAAAQLWFVHRSTASIFKLAYDDDFRDLSVGSVLTSTLMQHVIDVDRVSVVDYLCGDDSYKRDWMSARRERIGLRAIRGSTWQGALVHVASFVRRVARG